mmetsp:Transcript_42928/g.108378  ORF Transcript_42928/g.108378 Transcript_42928/m.108378 type:complete len:145 (-) Transcript_42928:970-1404(-)
MRHARFVSLCADGWTDDFQQSFMSISFHWADPKDWKICSSIGHIARVFRITHNHQSLKLVLQQYLEWFDKPCIQEDEFELHLDEDDVEEMKDAINQAVSAGGEGSDITYACAVVDGGSNCQKMAKEFLVARAPCTALRIGFSWL